MDPATCSPWETVRPLTQEELDEYRKQNPFVEKFYNTKDQQRSFIYVGPNGYLLPSGYLKEGPKIYAMEVRPSDVFVVSYPRSGSTWTQELIWMIGNDHDYKRASEKKLLERFTFLEQFPLFSILNTSKRTSNTPVGVCEGDQDMCRSNYVSVTDILNAAPSPRYIRTNLPLSLLPPTLLETSKVVYIARDPRDAAVSLYHYHKDMNAINFYGSFKTFWNYFINNFITYTPYFLHLKEAWEKRNHPNMLILFYEEFHKDMPATVRRVAQFLEKPITEEQVHRLCNHLHFDRFKQNKSVNRKDWKEIGTMNEDGAFVRKGKVGAWRADFDEEMTAQAEHWIKDNLRGTDLSFS